MEVFTMRLFTKKLFSLLAAISMAASTAVIGADAVTQEASESTTNTYLHSIRTYSYDSTEVETSVSTLTVCRKDDYTAILSCAEILKTKTSGTLSNATNFLPYADAGTFLKVTATRSSSYSGLYRRHWSYVRDEDGNTVGSINRTILIEF